MKTFTITAATLILLVCGAARADGPAPREGTGQREFVMVLNPDGGSGPDLERYGARLVRRWYNRVLIRTTDEVARELSKQPGVQYLQPILKPGQTSTYDPRTRQRSLKVAADEVTDPSWSSGEYKYDGSGNVIGIGTSHYLYDQSSRLKRARLNGTASAEDTYQYDSFGNLYQRTSTLASLPGQTVQISSTTNRLIATYDSVGNFVSGAGSPYTYDWDSFRMMSRKAGAGRQDYYVYDANDERIGALDNLGGVWRWTVRDLNGQVVREYESASWSGMPWLWIEDFVRNGRQVVGSEREAFDGGRRHFHADHLGSVRLVTNHSGQAISRHDYTPYGLEITSLRQEIERGYSRTSPIGFTGHERDYNSGTLSANTNYLDYMHARYHDSNMGRFLSVDPIIPSAAVREPQRWNRYAYVSNNPIKNTDPTGKLLEARAGACSDSTDKCYTKLDAYQAIKNWVGGDAAKYLQLGKNGQVTLKGISAANFMKLGGAAAIVGNLIRSTSSTAALSLSANVTDTAGRPTSAFTRPDAKGTLTEINPAMFPSIEGGATQTMDTALAHDLGGHGLQNMWGISGLDKRYGSMDQRVTPFVPYGEAFAVTMENIYRASQGMDIRGYYINPGDYDKPRP